MSATSLKILALILMTIDHIGLFFSKTPIFFQQIGRLSAPIFLFILVNSLTYTSNRKKFLIRLYIGNVVMCIITLFAKYVLSINEYLNIFGTFFAISVLIILIEYVKERRQNWIIFLIIYILLQLFSLVITYFMILNNTINLETFAIIIGALTSNIFSNEGRLYFIIMGLILYFTKNNKKKLILSYTFIILFNSGIKLFSVIPRIMVHLQIYKMNLLHTILEIFFGICGYNTIEIREVSVLSVFFNQFEWMSIGALPFMLMYNNKKGKGYKYFFYIYYPLHILLLEILSLVLS